MSVDPGRRAPTREPHGGGQSAKDIRAALGRLRPEHRAAKTRTDEEEAALSPREPRAGKWVVGRGWVPVDGGGPYEGAS